MAAPSHGRWARPIQTGLLLFRRGMGPVLPGGGLMADTAIAPTLAESGYELPYWSAVGDSDGATAGRSMEEQLTPILRVNGCPAVPDAAQDGGYRPDALRTAENYYTPEKGYTDGERLCTRILSGGGWYAAYRLYSDEEHAARRNP